MTMGLLPLQLNNEPNLFDWISFAVSSQLSLLEPGVILTPILNNHAFGRLIHTKTWRIKF